MTAAKCIVVVTGHTGAGKSTLVRQLCMIFSCPTISFHREGRRQAAETPGSMAFRSINDEIYRKIVYASKCAEIVVADGVVTPGIIERIFNDGYKLCHLFLDTTYEERIRRIAERENCTAEQAVLLEADKAAAKERAGAGSITKLPHYRLDGLLPPETLLKQGVDYIVEAFSI